MKTSLFCSGNSFSAGTRARPRRCLLRRTKRASPPSSGAGAENTWQRSIRANPTRTSVCHASGSRTEERAAALNNSWGLNGKYFGAFSWARRHNARVPVDGRFTAVISKLQRPSEQAAVTRTLVDTHLQLRLPPNRDVVSSRASWRTR